MAARPRQQYDSARLADAKWRCIGPPRGGRVVAVAGDPQDAMNNPDLVYVAALGDAFGPNTERGVFRSSDGGKSRRKHLSWSPT